MLSRKLEQIVAEAVRNTFGEFDHAAITVQVTEQAGHGDYATNAAMVLAKTVKKKPMEVAEELKPDVLAFGKEIIESVEIAPPGFLNLRVKTDALLSLFQDTLIKPEQWGSSNAGENKTVIVEYFQLNIAKRPHIGHLRSAVIGDALKRMLLASGYHAVSDTHVGDWGTQFGILLYAYKQAIKNNPDFEEEAAKEPFGKLHDLYVEENKKMDDPAELELRKREFAKLEQGDEENRKIWEWMVEISMKKLLESADRLGLLPFDEHKGESAYEDMMPSIVELALQKGVAKRDEKGAVIVDLTDERLDEAVLIKSDGASTYLLRDLATIKYRRDRWNFWKNLYVVDVGQSHHFRQVFRVAELLGFEGVGASEHISTGQMKLPEGKLSTRKGNIIYLDAVLDEAISRARNVIMEKNPDLLDADKVAEMVGVGAIKYFDLSHNRTSNIVFRWNDALAFEGNTGPYIQYTHARLKSILRKAKSDKHSVSITAGPVRRQAGLDDGERRLLVSLIRFPEAIERALGTWSPHVLASYLYDFAQHVNEFYHSHPVIQEPDGRKQQLRLGLVAAAALTIQNGLNLLGIEAPEEM